MQPRLPVGTRMMLARGELESYKATLSEWRSPEEFIRIVDDLMGKVGGLQFFTDTRIGFGRDAWVAAKLSSAFHPEAVRLGPDRWPDCETCTRGHVEQYEITEADVPGRKRGDEYKTAAGRSPDAPKLESDPVENWVVRADQVPAALEVAAELKAKKGYPKSARLVIYLNIGEYGIRQKEIEAAMAASTASAKDAFSQVWVLWKRRMYLVWNDAERTALVVQLATQDA